MGQRMAILEQSEQQVEHKLKLVGKGNLNIYKESMASELLKEKIREEEKNIKEYMDKAVIVNEMPLEDVNFIIKHAYSDQLRNRNELRYVDNGSFGTVYKYTSSNGRVYAIKVYSSSSGYLTSDGEILEQLQGCDLFCKLYFYIEDKIMVTEFIEGYTVNKVINYMGSEEDIDMKSARARINDGMNFIFEKKILPKDLHLGNFMFDKKDNNIKLVDVGCFQMEQERYYKLLELNNFNKFKAWDDKQGEASFRGLLENIEKYMNEKGKRKNKQKREEDNQRGRKLIMENNFGGFFGNWGKELLARPVKMVSVRRVASVPKVQFKFNSIERKNIIGRGLFHHQLHVHEHLHQEVNFEREFIANWGIPSTSPSTSLSFVQEDSISGYNISEKPKVNVEDKSKVKPNNNNNRFFNFEKNRKNVIKKIPYNAINAIKHNNFNIKRVVKNRN